MAADEKSKAKSLPEIAGGFHQKNHFSKGGEGESKHVVREGKAFHLSENLYKGHGRPNQNNFKEENHGFNN